MPLKKIKRKTSTALKTFREEGVVGLGIKSLQFTEKQLRRMQKSRAGSIQTYVKYNDALRVDFSKPLPKWPGTDRTTLRFNWIMPPPGKGSGGHFTLFRFIKALEDAGHDCRIYLYSQHDKATIADVRRAMGDSFTPLNAPMEWLPADASMKPADAIFATSWETAYPAYLAKQNAKRFYFVQDFEPFFYPVGGLSTLAENTYKFGFYGITAGGWLEQKLKKEYGMQTSKFDFGADSLYTNSNHGSRKEILYYARPTTPRRGFEVSILALDLFKQKHPEYTINFFGWDMSEYDIPFDYIDHKTIEHEEMNVLFNRCAAGLVLSMTNMSLLPLELLSSGVIPVTNVGDNNSMVADNPFIAYSQPDPVSLANKLSEVVTRKDAVAYAQKASASVKKASWQESGEKFVELVEKEVRKKS